MGSIDTKAGEKKNTGMFNEILDEITKHNIQLEDKYEVAAIIESMGWNDERVSEVFGVDDVFALASDLWDAIHTKITSAQQSAVEKTSVIKLIIMLSRTFLRGLIFALPMAISVFSMLTLRFSLWSYENLSLELATSIAMGTIMSFTTVGGFIQAIARRGFFYITQDYYNMARQITFFFIRLGYAVLIIFSLIFTLFNLLFEVFPMRMTIAIVLYYFLLTTIWLSVTVMYILRKELAFTGLLIIGILIVFILFHVFNMDIIFSQVIALVTVTFSGIIAMLYFFKRAEAKMEKGISPVLPRTSITLYSVMPYFVYGFLYFSFIFADRVIAWSTNNRSYMPYIIWFRGPYEFGLDLALLMLILPMGLIESIVSKLMIDLERSQKLYFAYESKKLSADYLRTYFQRLSTLSLISFFTAGLIYLVIRYIDMSRIIPNRPMLLTNPVSHFVFVVALLSYALISIALLNSIILFSLSQPEFVNSALLPALMANIATGFLLSRWIDYYYAVFGLFAGVVVFTALSVRMVVRVFKRLDYYLYLVM